MTREEVRAFIENEIMAACAPGGHREAWSRMATREADAFIRNLEDYEFSVAPEEIAPEAEPAPVMRPVMRRSFFGQDGWGAFTEEVAVSQYGRLGYRRVFDGKESAQWQGEAAALEFVFGTITVSAALRDAFVACLREAPTLGDGHCNMEEY